jgi:hypothetical protein
MEPPQNVSTMKIRHGVSAVKEKRVAINLTKRAGMYIFLYGTSIVTDGGGGKAPGNVRNTCLFLPIGLPAMIMILYQGVMR